jgi:hypothetical protein
MDIPAIRSVVEGVFVAKAEIRRCRYHFPAQRRRGRYRLSRRHEHKGRGHTAVQFVVPSICSRDRPACFVRFAQLSNAGGRNTGERGGMLVGRYAVFTTYAADVLAAGLHGDH